MKPFLKNIVLFILPLILLVITPIVILYGTGENYHSLSRTFNEKEKYLVGYAYNEINYKAMKWHALMSHSSPKQVWALGSSRVLQLRDSAFTVPFYNAGYTVASISQYLPFLKSLPKERYPETIVLGVDQWMFNEHYDMLVKSETSYWKESFQMLAGYDQFSKVYKDLWSGKYGFEVIQDQGDNGVHRIGLNAIVNGKGFRNDGTIDYGNQVEKLLMSDSTANDYLFKNTLRDIQNRQQRWRGTNRIHKEAVNELQRFLSFCASNDIHVIGFLPPFAGKVYDEMVRSNDYPHVSRLYQKIFVHFTKYGFELWDMSDCRKFKSSDHEMIDGFHGSELTYLRMMKVMLENGSKLQNYSSIKKMHQDIQSRCNRYNVYKY